MSIAPRTVIVLGLAIGAAALTGVATHQWLTAQRALDAAREAPAAGGAPQLAMTKVLVAARDIATGTFITAEDLVWRSWPRDAVSQDYVEQANGSMEAFTGSVARSKIFANEPVTGSRVVHPGEQGFLAAVLDPGKRAVAVPVDVSTGIAGFVFPGDRVDVLLSYRINSAGGAGPAGNVRHFSRTLLSAVRVLAVDQSVDNPDGEARPAKTVTLEVTRKQAEKLALSLEFGALSLSLRSLIAESEIAAAEASAGNDGDAGGSGPGASFTRDIDVMYLSSDEAVSEPSEDQVRQIRVLRGKESEEIVY